MEGMAGKVAFITGAARGQGRSHAVALAQAGADIIAVDISAQIDSVPYALARADDLAETVRQVEAAGRRVLAADADVRDLGQLHSVCAKGSEAFGPIDVVIANAGIAPFDADDDPRRWQDVIDVNLTGAYNTVEAALPYMRRSEPGGSIVMISSIAGLTGHSLGSAAGLAYNASKHGVVGLMRTYANTLAKYSIRVNSIHPTGVRTPMVENPSMTAFLEQAERERGWSTTNALPVEIIESSDVTAAVMYLVSQGARYVTGVELPVDAGYCVKN